MLLFCGADVHRTPSVPEIDIAKEENATAAIDILTHTKCYPKYPSSFLLIAGMHFNAWKITVKKMSISLPSQSYSAGATDTQMPV